MTEAQQDFGMSEQEDVIEIVAKVASPASAGWQAAEAPAAAPAGGRQPAAQGEPGKASEQPPAGTADGGTQPWTEAEAEQASDASCQRQPADTTGPHAMDAAELVRPETEEEITADAGLDDDVSDDAGSGTTAADQDGTGDEQAQQAQQAAAAADAAQAAAAEEAVLAGSAAAETVKQKSQPSAADEHAKEASNPQADTLARAADEAAAGPKPSPAAQPAGEAAPASNHPNPAQRNLQALHDELLAFAAEVSSLCGGSKSVGVSSACSSPCDRLSCAHSGGMRAPEQGAARASGTSPLRHAALCTCVTCLLTLPPTVPPTPWIRFSLEVAHPAPCPACRSCCAR